MTEEQIQLSTVSARRAEIDGKKREVEDNIMRGFSNPSTPVGEPSPGFPGRQKSPATPGVEPDRPQVEAITPPDYPAPPNQQDVPAGFSLNGSMGTAAPGLDLSGTVSAGYGTGNGNGSVKSGSAKKRKLENDFPDLGGDDLDADVAEMLRQS